MDDVHDGAEGRGADVAGAAADRGTAGRSTMRAAILNGWTRWRRLRIGSESADGIPNAGNSQVSPMDEQMAKTRNDR